MSEAVSPKPSAAPDITVAICTYNRAGVLPLALASLTAQQTGGAFTYDIVVVDDASTDATQEVIAAARAAAPVPLTCAMGQGQGVAAARNLCWQTATGAWVAYTDDDQVNEFNWLATLWALAQKHATECVGGAVHLRFDEPPTMPLTWVTKGMLGFKEHPEKRITRLMECPGTGNVMFKRALLERLGGFDNGLHWGGEDAELMVRVLDAGVEVWFTPDSVVHHLIPPYRVKESYFKWCSLRVGVALAEVDARTRGKAVLALLCCARLAQALLKNLPQLMVAKLRGDAGAVLEKRCVLWRCGTYLRASLYLMAPGLFPQRAFFEGLSFRGERTSIAAKAN